MPAAAGIGRETHSWWFRCSVWWHSSRSRICKQTSAAKPFLKMKLCKPFFYCFRIFQIFKVLFSERWPSKSIVVIPLAAWSQVSTLSSWCVSIAGRLNGCTLRKTLEWRSIFTPTLDPVQLIAIRRFSFIGHFFLSSIAHLKFFLGSAVCSWQNVSAQGWWLWKNGAISTPRLLSWRSLAGHPGDTCLSKLYRPTTCCCELNGLFRKKRFSEKSSVELEIISVELEFSFGFARIFQTSELRSLCWSNARGSPCSWTWRHHIVPTWLVRYNFWTCSRKQPWKKVGNTLDQLSDLVWIWKHFWESAAKTFHKFHPQTGLGCLRGNFAENPQRNGFAVHGVLVGIPCKTVCWITRFWCWFEPWLLLSVFPNSKTNI